ncbi:MAG: hypothetical protein HY319_03250 [Armatimonadetes bacterium]|nr:hypothetical protein [Armatimonadota bacterium]
MAVLRIEDLPLELTSDGMSVVGGFKHIGSPKFDDFTAQVVAGIEE